MNREIEKSHLKPPSLKTFYLLWSTQSLSQLGSQMTSFAFSLWLFEQTGSALQTALLNICSYGPYVLMSLFAGAWADRWDLKKTMLICDALSALCSVTAAFRLVCGLLKPADLYLLCALSGLLNTFQSPACDVAVTLITPRSSWGKISGLRAFSRSVISFATPMLAAALFGLGGMKAVLTADLVSFAAAFLTLAFLIRIPPRKREKSESFFSTVSQGFFWLNQNRMVLGLILFLAFVNLMASMFDAVLPAFILLHPQGGQTVYGLVSSAAGLAMILGSVLVSLLPAPKNRIRLIVGTMLFSLSTDNFLMSLSTGAVWWITAQFLGYVPVPMMDASLDVVLRVSIPEELQGRVYAVRNALQFFTIPLGLFLGGWLCDSLTAAMKSPSPAAGFFSLFGRESWSAAAGLIFLLGVVGSAGCLLAGKLLNAWNPSAPSGLSD